MTRNGASAEQASSSQAAALSSLHPLTHIQGHKAVRHVALPWRLPKAPSHIMQQVYQDRESKQLYLIHRNKHRQAVKLRRQRNTAQVKEQNKTLEKELNEMEIANLSDAEFKTLVITMLREFTEYGKSIREEMKDTLSGIKKNPQGTNSEGKEAGVQINDLEHKEAKNCQPEQNEQEFKTTRRG